MGSIAVIVIILLVFCLNGGALGFRAGGALFGSSRAVLQTMQLRAGASDTAKTSTATLLRCDRIAKTFRDRPQFEGVSLTLCAGHRIGLIGANGAGGNE